jgi:VanZ family protein
LLGALAVVAQIFTLNALPFELVEPWDKVWHVLAYGALTLLLWIATDGRRPMLVVTAVMLLGAGDELRQALTPSGHDKLIETVRGTGYRFKPDFATANLAA